MESSDYEDAFVMNQEFFKECDQIESTHNSPVKDPNFLSPSSFSSFDPPSPTRNTRGKQNSIASLASTTWPLYHPATPSKDRVTTPNTPYARRHAVERAFKASEGPLNQSPTPRRTLFRKSTKPSGKKKASNLVVDVVSSDSEDNMQVDKTECLIDTDIESPTSGPSPISAQNSISSIGFDWSKIETFSSFQSVAGESDFEDLETSPSKYRKLSNASHSINESTARSGSSQAAARQSLFSVPFPSARRNDGWVTSASTTTGSSAILTEGNILRARSSSAADQVSPSKSRKLPASDTPTKRGPVPTHSRSLKPAVVDDVFSISSSLPPHNDKAPTPTTAVISIPPPSGVDSALEEFLAGPLGVDLEPHIIAHNAEVVTVMDKERIAWGTQWEICRGITGKLWTWDDVKSKLHLLKGSNSEKAASVVHIMLDKPIRLSDTSVWQELDREQEAILENKDRGLGLMGEWHGESDWYGGQVQQLARIVKGNEGEYKIRLEPLEKRRSHRLARYLGSRRVIQLRVPKDLLLKENKRMKEFMRSKHILCGRVFVLLTSKDHAAYLVETDENYERISQASFGDNSRLPFKAIVNWHNRLDLNVDQPISKYVTRFALALSTSVPILEFREENILRMEDQVAPYDGPGKPPAELIHTDGCGFINAAGLREIGRKLGIHTLLAAVQGRIEGGKGLWILHPKDTNQEPKIWIRDSQKKIAYPRPLHRAHRIFDLLSVSRPSGSVSLSKQTIMNLFENLSSKSVPFADKLMIELMEKALIDEVKPLMQWQGSEAMTALWDYVNQLCSVSRMRLVRRTAGWSRALGLTRQNWRGQEIDVEKEDEIPPELEEEPESNSGRTPSGSPVSLSEIILELLQAGYHPLESHFLRDKMRFLVKTTIDSIVDKFSIPLPESKSALIVPDPRGVLEEGEVFYRSSEAFPDPETQEPRQTITGEVVVGRYPVRLASDMQKVKAVECPELNRWTDVLIVSTKGKTSFASYLSGGDYDGDTVFIIREKCLVEPFRNFTVKPLPPNFMEENFQEHREQVRDFARRVSKMSPQDAQTAFADVLTLSLEDAKFGLYSTYQDYAIYKHGYQDRRSERLAYIFNALLDSSKTGVHLKDGIFEKDRSKFGGTIPEASTTNAGKTQYIFHSLQESGKATSDKLLAEYDILTGNTRVVKDQGLLRPYQDAFDNAQRLYERRDISDHDRKILSNELDRIRQVVNKAWEEWSQGKRQLVTKDPNVFSPTKKQAKPKGRNTQRVMAPVYSLYNREVEDLLFFQNAVEDIKASYAYTLDPTFGFFIAFSTLCHLKAKQSPYGSTASTRPFDESKAISSTFRKTISHFIASTTS